VIGLGLRQVQDALNRKGNAVQQEFIALSERIDQAGKDLLESRDEERKRLREEQASLRSAQQELADEINLWRERARAVLRQSGREGIRAYLNELLELGEDIVKPAIEHALYLLDVPEEELARLQGSLEPQQLTPAGRLIERARTDYDLRGSDQTVRQREAVNFANRAGIAQDDEALGEIEAAMNDPDPLVRELAVLTNIQIHRFRALRVADLDIAHEAVQYLSRLSYPPVIPVLVEILENPRTGFTAGEEGVVDSDNNRSRMVALLRLVEWHTAEAKSAVYGRKFDLDSHIAKAAERSLELFPGPWSGPLKGTGSLAERS
jgi:hypothetical protein